MTINHDLNRTPIQRLDLHIDTLFRCDPDGRLRCVNEMGDPLAPRFYMGRTAEGNRWRFRHDLPGDLIDALDPLCQSEPTCSEFVSLPQNYAAIRAVLEKHAPIQQEYRGPAYWIPNQQRTTEAVLISTANAHLLKTHFAWAISMVTDAKYGPIAVALVEGIAVSICFCSRIPGRATEAGVETVAAAWGKGLATAAVARWAEEVWRLGYLPLYGTSWGNLASQRIARKLDMLLYGEDWSVE